jgi:hypothetical protein
MANLEVWSKQLADGGRAVALLNRGATPAQIQADWKDIAYLPALEFDGPIPAARPYFAVRSEFWKLPKNAKDLLDLVHWAAADEISLSVDGPPFLVANLTRQARNRRWYLHLVNYRAPMGSTVSSVSVGVGLLGGQRATRVTVCAPESPAPAA